MIKFYLLLNKLHPEIKWREKLSVVKCDFNLNFEEGSESPWGDRLIKFLNRLKVVSDCEMQSWAEKYKSTSPLCHTAPKIINSTRK